jgi:uncharacterized protein with GYD domain
VETYIFLTKWTDQGVKDSRNSVDRATAAVEAMESMGVKIFEMYWTVGPYDLILVADCPDQATAHAVSLRLAQGGNVRPVALRAFDRGEMNDLVAKLD